MTSETKSKSKKRRPITILWILFGVLLAFILALLVPWNITGLNSHPRPVQNYAEALQRIEALQTAEGDGMDPLCRVQFLTHGQKVERVIVFVHGYTACPHQFAELGQRFYDLGYNVLIVPLPHHGLADRMTEDQANLTAEELAAYADEVVDIAQGLGDMAVLAGISGGGVTTAWAAQNRSDLGLAVIISPGFGYKQVPTPLTAAAENIYMLLPNSFVWWDPVRQMDGSPVHSYPRYATHPLVQILRLGFAVQAAARRAPPAAHSLIVVTNANDASVNNELTAQVVLEWTRQGADVSTFEFGKELQLGHDLIDPSQPDQKIDVVYPQLIELITR